MKNNGRIVNVSSGTVLAPSPEQGLYASSKAAVRTLTEVASMELGGRGIRVNSVMPGLIATQLTTDIPEQDWNKAVEQTALGRRGHPDDIAGVVAFLTSDDSRWVTGQHVLVNGGMIG